LIPRDHHVARPRRSPHEDRFVFLPEKRTCGFDTNVINMPGKSKE
jgi:hypothetical protein